MKFKPESNLDFTGHLIPILLELSLLSLVTISLLVCSYLTLLIHFSENVIYSVISLLSLTIVTSLLLLLLCNLDFFAILYIIIYLGAIIVLFLFVLMTADLRKEETTMSRHWRNMLPFASIFSLFLIVIFFPNILNAIVSSYSTLNLLDYITPTGNWHVGRGFATWQNRSQVFEHHSAINFHLPTENFLTGFGTSYEVYLNDIFLFSQLLYGFFFDYAISMVLLLFFTLVVSVGVCSQTEDYTSHIRQIQTKVFGDTHKAELINLSPYCIEANTFIHDGDLIELDLTELSSSSVEGIDSVELAEDLINNGLYEEAEELLDLEIKATLGLEVFTNNFIIDETCQKKLTTSGDERELGK